MAVVSTSSDFLRRDGYVQAEEGKAGGAGLQSGDRSTAALLPGHIRERLHPLDSTTVPRHHIRQDKTLETKKATE